MPVIIGMHAEAFDEVRREYETIGFEIYADDVDGIGNRYLRMKHRKFPFVSLNFQADPRLIAYRQLENAPASFPRLANLSLLVNPQEWHEISALWKRVLDQQVTAFEEPFGCWLYFDDAHGNLIEVTTCDLW
jgi:hypothetical protein